MVNSQHGIACRTAIQGLFDSVQVINLPTRADRRSEMTRELARIGLSFSDGGAVLLPASRFDDPGGFDSRGARGCFDSHVRALTAARDAGARAVLILEDDCDFASDAGAVLPLAVAALGATEWSIFYGGYLDWDGASTGAQQGPVVLADPRHAIKGSHFVAVNGPAIGPLVAYFEAMAAREPGSPLGGPMHVDGAYSWFRRDHPELATFVARPQLAYQRPSRTDIHQLSLVDRLPVSRQLMAMARQVKRLALKARRAPLY